MKKVMNFSTILILLISILLPVKASANASSYNFITASRTVTPAPIFTDEEADVTLNVTGTPPVNVVKPNDIILVLDKSGSMTTDNRFNSMISAAKSFVDLIDLSKHSVGIVDFSTGVNNFPLSTDSTAVKNYIDNIRVGGNTNTGQALTEATNLLSNHRPDAQPVIVLLTDGQANDPEAAKLASEAAKDAGIVFYTIALLGPHEDPKASPPNQLLEEMATTAHHHHFVLGSVGLQQVYEAIVEEIGLASAYDVTITENVDPNFEIVPGSYDNNIPQPTVTGNKLVWNMEEVKANTLQFHYKIRLKQGIKAGSYSVASSYITYKDYTGTSRLYNVPNIGLTVKNRAPEINSITDSKGNVKGGDLVTIKGKNFRSGVKVFFDNVEVPNIQLIDENTITLNAPPGKQGEVIVKVQNDDFQSAEGKYSYWANPEVTLISPNIGPFEGLNTVKIDGKYLLNGVQVKFGDKYGQVQYNNSSSINVIVPPADKVGLVDVTLENPDGTKTTVANGYTYKEPKVIDLQVTPMDITLSPGETQQLTVTGLLSDNSSKDSTKGSDGTTYKSNATNIASVSPDGLVSIPVDAKDGWKTSIIVENNGAQRIVNVTIKDTRVKLTDLSINVDKIELAPGQSKQLAVNAIYSDNSTKDVTLTSEGTTYSSSLPSAATVDSNGLLTVPSNAKFGYSSILTISFGGISKVVNVTIINPAPKVASLNVTPATLALEPGQTAQLAVEGTMTDGSVRDVTAASEGTTYVSDSVGSATVTTSGIITVSSHAVIGSTIIITVSNNGVSKDVTLTIKKPAPKLSRIDVTPSNSLIDMGSSKQLSVIGTYDDGSTKDLTLSSEGTLYTSTSPSSVSVSKDGLIAVAANATANSRAYITIANGSASQTIIITVNDPTPKVTSFTVNPSSTLTLAPGGQRQLVVTATMSDGSTKDISKTSDGTTYLNGGSNFMSVNSNGVVSLTSNAPDGAKAYITVINNGYSQTLVLTVVDPTPKVKSFAVTPSNITIAPGGTLQLSVLGTLSDNTTKDITQGSTGTAYTSNNPGIVSVNANGLISAPANAADGATTSIFIVNNGIGQTIPVRIVDPSVKITDMTVSPLSFTMLVGTTQQLNVLGKFSDGSTKDVTLASSNTTYSSLNTSFATVSPDGLITLNNNATNGSKVYINVINKGISKVVTIIVTTNPNLMVALNSSPASLSLKAGTSGQLTINGTTITGVQKDVTLASAGTTYTSNATIIATVSANGLVTIPASARVGYTTTIIVANGGMSILVNISVI